MIPALALALVLLAGLVAALDLIRSRGESLPGWGLLVLVLSLLAERAA